jgi:hypothetical protein
VKTVLIAGHNDMVDHRHHVELRGGSSLGWPVEPKWPRGLVAMVDEHSMRDVLDDAPVTALFSYRRRSVIAERVQRRREERQAGTLAS